MTEARAIKRLINGLDNIQGQVIAYTVNTSISDIRACLALLADEWKEFQALEKSLKGKFDETNLEAVDKLETLHFDLKQRLFKWEKQYEENHTQQGNMSMEELMFNQSNFLQEISSMNKRENDVRLPRVNIPSFDGNYSEFPSFRDLFEASIHNNKNISKVHKLQYLKGILKGEAYALINHVAITDANYDEAWDKIKTRYDKRKHVVQTLLKQFIEQPNINQSCSKLLRRLTDTSDEVLRGLKVLGSQAESRDPWLIYIIINKLDNDSKEAWAHESAENDFPTVEQLFNFLNKRSDALESLGTIQKSKPIITKRVSALATKTLNVVCPICSGEHYVSKCDQYLSLAVPERKQIAAERKLCFNCLSSNHQSTVCRSRYSCRICKRRHHITLHSEIEVNSNKEPKSAEINPSNQLSSASCNTILKNSSTITEYSPAILPTAVVSINDKYGRAHKCRVLLDSGSQSSFVTEKCARRLQLQRYKANISITGITTGSIISKGKTVLLIQSIYDAQLQITVSALIINNLPANIPSSNINFEDNDMFQNIQLADPDFNKSTPIDILLGADTFFAILEDGQRQSNSFILQNSLFGWIVSGRNQLPDSEVSSCVALNLRLDMDIDATLRKFWEIEELSQHSSIPPEDKQCEEFLKQLTKDKPMADILLSFPLKKRHRLWEIP